MNFYAGQELPGKIVIQESLEPFNQKNPRKDLKIAGSTGIVCTLNGQPIYRRTIYKQDSFAENKLIQHDNVEQLRNAYAAESGKSSAIKPNTAEDFSIGA
jgi:adenine specific DNA methylase Mod